LGDQPSQDFVLFNEAIKAKIAAMQKWTEATSESTKAKQEQTRRDLYQTYAKLLDKDTSNFTEKQLKRHEDVLEKLAKEIAEA
jgi:DNA topoisomerase VI subunit B